MGEHLFSRQTFEMAPAKCLLVHFLLSAGDRELPVKLGGVFHACEFGIGYAFQVEIVQPFHKEQIGDLLDCRDGICDAAAPELIPELIYFTFDC